VHPSKWKKGLRPPNHHLRKDLAESFDDFRFNQNKFLGCNKNLDAQIISERFAIVVEIPFSLLLESSLEEA
jgi:hypothetical protein